MLANHGKGARLDLPSNDAKITRTPSFFCRFSPPINFGTLISAPTQHSFVMASQRSWPPSSGLTTVNVPREAAVLTTSASARISAPADAVFETVLKVGEYGKWNAFAPKVTIHSQPSGEGDGHLHTGTLFTLHVVMDEKKPQSYTPTQLIVTDISTPERPSKYIAKDILDNEDSFTADLGSVYRIGWKCEGGFASKGLKTERFHEVVSFGPNECGVRTWECQGGMLAYTVRWLYKKTLEGKFQLWCDDLKKFCEAQVVQDSR